MHHWTDSKIRVHAFYCMLGISLLQYIHRESKSARPGLSKQIQQFALLYPPQGDKGPHRVATVLSKQTLAQQTLAEVLALNALRSTLSR
jgi:transposase